MQKHVSNRAQFLAPDALPRIMANWGAATLIAGFCWQQWCQKRGAESLHNIQDCLFNRPRAFILGDVEFYRDGHILVPIGKALENVKEVAYVKLRYMWQKNKKHKQFQYYFRNDNKHFLCPVRTWIEIVK